MPVSASPLPPLANAGEPTVFSMNFGPSSSIAQITDMSLFSTAVQSYFSANAWAAASRSDRISSVLLPNNRAASPGWGVMTAFLPNFMGCLASRFRASASQTEGFSGFHSFKIFCQISSLWPNPQPSASTSWAGGFFNASAMSRHMALGTRVCRMGIISFSQTTVVSPAPAVTAALAHMAAAPVMPMFPA